MPIASPGEHYPSRIVQCVSECMIKTKAERAIDRQRFTIFFSLPSSICNHSQDTFWPSLIIQTLEVTTPYKLFQTYRVQDIPMYLDGTSDFLICWVFQHITLIKGTSFLMYRFVIRNSRLQVGRMSRHRHIFISHTYHIVETDGKTYITQFALQQLNTQHVSIVLHI